MKTTPAFNQTKSSSKGKDRISRVESISGSALVFRDTLTNLTSIQVAQAYTTWHKEYFYTSTNQTLGYVNLVEDGKFHLVGDKCVRAEGDATLIVKIIMNEIVKILLYKMPVEQFGRHFL